MKIASGVFKSGTIDENLENMKRQMREAKENGAEVILFSECQLCSFCVGENVIADRKVAMSATDDRIKGLCELAKELELWVGFGFLELKDGGFYDSYAMIEKKGSIREIYRRVTKTWHKEVRGDMYCEGESVFSLSINGLCVSIMICGDLYDDILCAMVNSLEADICFIPMARCMDKKVTQAIWEKEEKEYIKQMAKLNTNVLIINQLYEKGDYFGGVSAICTDGSVESRLPIYTEGIHYLDI